MTDTTDDRQIGYESVTDTGAGALAHGTSTWKVLGSLDDGNGVGVLGHNTATTGTGRGVLGSVDSRTDGATGVYGEATAATGEVHGVVGQTHASTTNNQQPAGVYARSTAGGDALRAESNGMAIRASGGGLSAAELSSPGSGFNVGLFATAEGTEGNPVQGLATESGNPGSTKGIFGRTSTPGDAASDIYPIGVHGRSESTSGTTVGVKGNVASTAGPGVVGLSATSGYSFSYSGQGATGVTGITDKSTDAADLDFVAAIEGVASSSGPSYGVYGHSTGEGYGLYTPDDANTGGTHEIGGGTVHSQRGEPTTAELEPGEVMNYNSNGNGTGSAGDLVYAVNDGGTIKTKIIVSRSNAT